MNTATFRLGELVYLTNSLARGDPDDAFTAHSGPGMIVGVLVQEEGYIPRYRIKWLKSGEEQTFHGNSPIRVPEVKP